MNHSKNQKNTQPRHEAGSEEQHLDMIEGGETNLRGDDVTFTPDEAAIEDANEPVRGVDEMMSTFNVDMSEENREGDEMSGDDHSSGMQGGESELLHQENIESGMPGETTDEQDREFDKRGKRRAA